MKKKAELEKCKIMSEEAQKFVLPDEESRFQSQDSHLGAGSQPRTPPAADLDAKKTEMEAQSKLM